MTVPPAFRVKTTVLFALFGLRLPDGAHEMFADMDWETTWFSPHRVGTAWWDR